ncbi:MAG: DmsC/YnfH family molybdoenzyme membrane anchor subunit [Pseudomonadota bacterium]
MNPAASIIVFTSLSGTGFGLMFWLGLGFPHVTGWTAFWYFTVAYGLAVVGLTASAFHLGNPQRALKAFTQYRTSWLSREAWLSVMTLTVMAGAAYLAVFEDTVIPALGWVGAVLSLLTVFGTSMIYTQLKTVPRWNHWSTPVVFLAYAIAGGAILTVTPAHLAIALLVILGALQAIAWNIGAEAFQRRPTDLGTATGLGTRGSVRAFEPPHTGTNYLLKEMVYQVARRRAAQLRQLNIGLSVVIPIAFLLLAPDNIWVRGIALALHVAGVFASRWLFFAEAEHVVGLYYGRREPQASASR